MSRKELVAARQDVERLANASLRLQNILDGAAITRLELKQCRDSLKLIATWAKPDKFGWPDSIAKIRERAMDVLKLTEPKSER